MGMLHHYQDEEDEETIKKTLREIRIKEFYDDCPMFGPKPEDFDKDGNPIW